MDRYTKGFVLASLVYLMAAGAIGALTRGAAASPEWVKFAHVHFNLAGFMSMMIYGVGYFILPRFNGTTLKFPGWVPIHFWLANIGLLGMVSTFRPEIPPAFHAFAAVSVIGNAVFVVNLVATMLFKEADAEEEPVAAPAPGPATASTGAPDATSSCCSPAAVSPQDAFGTDTPVALSPDLRVGELITRWPHAADALVKAGLGGLADPAHREQIKSIPVTVRMACQRHNLDLGPTMLLLSEATGLPIVAAGPAPTAASPAPAGGKASVAVTATVRRGAAIGPDAILGDILAVYPETEKVFRKHFGGGCFSCPGQKTESVRQSALLHNLDMKAVLADLNKAAGATSPS
ncbi:MAG TPA: hypothetical protein VGK27_02850 [Candidatus Deferrimicrobiaceae bacterium]|jgi:hypothetical protein